MPQLSGGVGYLPARGFISLDYEHLKTMVGADGLCCGVFENYYKSCFTTEQKSNCLVLSRSVVV